MTILARPFIAKLGLAALAGVSALPLHAQSTQAPAAIERTIPNLPSQPLATPSISTPDRPSADAETSTDIRFTLGAVHIEGATVFTPDTLSRDFEPYLATEVDEPRLNAIARQVTERYREAGYLLSYAVVPKQEVNAGIVRLDVVEGRVDRILVEGAGEATAEIEARTAVLLGEAPLRIHSLERMIGLLRDLPGFSVVDVSLARSTSDPINHTLRLKLVRDRTKVLLYTDNRGTDENGRARVYLSSSLSSIATIGDELRIDLFAIPGDGYRFLYGQVAASTPIGHNGLRFGISASNGDQRQRGGNRIDGGSTNFTAQLSYPLLRSRGLSALAKLSVSDLRDISEVDDVDQRDRLRVARIGLALSSDGATRIDADLSLSRGIAFDKMTRLGDPRASRDDAGGKFTKAAFQVRATRPLSDAVRLKLVAAGQYSDRSVLSVEEFALGGTQVGRGYDFNALTGDHGLGAGAELAWRLGNLSGALKQVELFGFADGGWVRQKNSGSDTLASLGAGFRLNLAGVHYSVEAGVPLRNAGEGKSVRVFVSAFKSF